MANTTNFNWETPDDTDLVKDGAAAIRTLAGAIDTSLVDLKGGTTGQVLSKATGTDMDFTWVTSDDANAIQNAIVDAKGDIVAASANDTPARLAVGTDNHRLVAASGETTGLKYVADTQNTVIDAAGDLLYGTAADTLARLGIGTAGQVLKVNSGATAPEWGSASGTSYTWTDFTPTFTNFTLGNGTIDQARYLQIDKIVFVMVNVILGSTSSVTGTIQITCPVTSSVPDYTHLFDCNYADDSAGIAVRGQAFILTNKINLRANTADQTYVRITSLSSTIPFTWASSDSFNFFGFYRAS